MAAKVLRDELDVPGSLKVTLEHTPDERAGEGCVFGFSIALAGSRGLAAGIRDYTQAVYPRRSADRRLPVATYPLEYGDKLRGCAAYSTGIRGIGCGSSRPRWTEVPGR